VIAEREKEDYYRYEINEVFSFDEDDGDADMVRWFSRFPKGTKAYYVGTPQGIALYVVKLGSDFKSYSLMPYPMSG
jgi:hypothetical protein